MSEETAQPRRLTESEARLAVDVLCEAFADYPVMRYVIGSGPEPYERRLRTLIDFFVSARLARDEPILIICEAGEAVACAMLTLPGRSSPAELAELRERTWEALGSAARERYEGFSEACRRFAVDTPNYHLNMIGVRPGHHGRGLARALMDTVHGMSEADPGSSGVTLTTEDPANVDLYRHMDYRVVGHVRVAPDLESWSFFRPDRA